MDKYTVLLSYLDKQMKILDKLYAELITIELSVYEKGYLFATKMQHYYTAIEDMLKQVAKKFENHIENLSSYHTELLNRLHMDIPNIRPALLSKESFQYLNKLRSFRHFMRHAYDCELDENELRILQKRLETDHDILNKDIINFRDFVADLAESK